MQTKSRLVAALCAAVLFLTVGCSAATTPAPGDTAQPAPGGTPATPQEPPTVAVGIPIPMSGPLAWYGEQFKAALDLAMQDLAAETDLGFTVRPVVLDSKCTPNDTTAAARRMIDQDKVVAIIGEFCTGATLALSQLTQDAQVPHIVYSSLGTEITEQGNPYLFRIIPHNRMVVESLGAYVKQSPYQRLAVVTEQSDYGLDAAKVFREGIAGGGQEIVAYQEMPPKETDFLPWMTELKDKQVDAIIFLSTLQHGVGLTRALKDSGMELPLISGIGLSYPVFDELAGPGATEGMIRQVLFVPGTDDPKAAAFEQGFEAATGRAPEHYAAEMYDAVMTVVDALQRSGVADKGYDKDAFLAALKATNYRGVMGPISFDANGQAPEAGRVKMAITRNGKLEPLD